MRPILSITLAGMLMFSSAFLSSVASAKNTPIDDKRPSPAAFDYVPIDDDERGMWQQMDELEREVKASKFLIKDPELNAYLNKVLCNAVGESCKRVRIYLMRTPQFNASMAPNGMMIVWSGLLLRARNEAELASVLAHEYSHFEKLHSLQSMRSIKKKTDAMAWMSFVPYVGMIGQIGVMGSIFSFNREMEKEADMESLDHLAHGGYDPMAAAQIWQQLRAEMDATAKERNRKSKKDYNGGFFATHPNSGERMDYLTQAASKRTIPGHRTNQAEYRAALSKWWPQLIDDQIKLNDFGATNFLLEQLASDGWTPELLYAKGELHRARAKDDDFSKASEYYREAVAKQPLMAEAWRGLGLVLTRSGDVSAGKKALRKYLEIEPQAVDKALIKMMAGGAE
jgi:beta-barrel assembly-enhancing protease